MLDSHARGDGTNGTSVEKLCASDHSLGPSFAHRLERQFCRMTDKTLWPFCESSKGLDTDCFDEDAEVLVEDGAPLARRDAHWDSIEHWGPTGKFKRDMQGTGELVQFAASVEVSPDSL